jgi:glycosyltransferase involved in cell wall biosynthesis
MHASLHEPLTASSLPSPEPTVAAAASAVATPRVCVLIPCYREAAHIRAVVEGARATGHHVVVVDDGSPDDTAAVAAAAGAHVLRHAVNRGKGAAMVTGYEHVLKGDYDAVIALDGDGQHATAEIPRFVECLAKTGAKVIVGTRMHDTRKMPWLRRLTNRVMSGVLSWQMGQRVPDTQCGYRLLHRDALPLLLTRRASTGFAAESESLLWLARHGFQIASVPISTIYGDEKSKIRPLRDTWRFLAMLWRFRKER